MVVLKAVKVATHHRLNLNSTLFRAEDPEFFTIPVRWTAKPASVADWRTEPTEYPFDRGRWTAKPSSVANRRPKPTEWSQCHGQRTAEPFTIPTWFSAANEWPNGPVIRLTRYSASLVECSTAERQQSYAESDPRSRRSRQPGPQWRVTRTPIWLWSDCYATTRSIGWSGDG